MKSSIWILDSSLLLLCAFVFSFIFFSQQKLPLRAKLTTNAVFDVVRSPSLVVDTSYIYENDIFGTYIASVAPVEEEPLKFLPIPKAPSAPITAPVLPEQPQFLEPLALTLSGVFIDKDEEKNRAIIINTKINSQKTYKVGDLIEDAELLSIFDTSVLFVRSNGQEETLFINKQAAQEDPAYTSQNNWGGIILKENENNYFINPTTFVERVPHLAQFFELLDAATVYKKGRSCGVRVGKAPSESLAMALGIQAGDIIVNIFNISVADTSDRVAVYNIIKQASEGAKIPVKILRGSEEFENIYILKNLNRSINSYLQEIKHTEKQLPEMAVAKRFSEPVININQEKRLLAQSQMNFAPRVQQMQKRDRQAMMRRPGNRGLTRSIPS